MTNLEKYNKVFCTVLGVKETELNEDLVYQRHRDWDSLAHMDLVVQLEELFDLSLSSLDVTSLNSYEKGKEILSRLGVDL